ncbi:MAG: phosphoenolpyruvate carboxylase, phosphoenolpyruvate carboxylase [Candidatus Peregrinibacteria bacterium GW2011_GWF2_43_17]|nr:MAG: phosphoenolpyruvate carboxylase, phosphoenolpyruvate carboxylase [Candidatus Peregrinibacteria bacterium GW2011_GWF2_43_17]KKT18708.1 MAG: Phosphoenolpyruvate carboxylase [Candidatus Peregrinibacteria bacterium GW2011_GWA2_43_8]
MGTQHPDNAGVPFWGDKPFIESRDETKEVFENFFTLDCDEYMWDWEGKFADEAMIERLLSTYMEHFKKSQIGRDKFITIRIPNVWEEKTFKLARAYMSVLSAAEFAKSFRLATPPVFEFILPMTTTASQLAHIQETFRKTAKLHESIFGKSDFGDGYIRVIPIFESVEEISSCSKILKEFLASTKEKPSHMRVFIARSDPALNAGFVSAMLAVRLGFSEIFSVEKETGIKMYPIIGTGSLPFRGGINPENIKHSLPQYKGAKTITIQSAFRYDYPLADVKKALAYIKKELEKDTKEILDKKEFEKLQKLIRIFKEFYRETVEKFAPQINEMSKFIPGRRERVQHIGLLGYSRGIGETKLPRAIQFTAACYSLGVPPEFIGTGRGLVEAKKQGLLETLKTHFPTIVWELKHAGKFVNKENLEKFSKKYKWAKEIIEDIKLCEEILKIQTGPQKDHHYLHRNLTSNIAVKRELEMDFAKDIVEAAVLRKSLG